MFGADWEDPARGLRPSLLFPPTIRGHVRAARLAHVMTRRVKVDEIQTRFTRGGLLRLAVLYFLEH